MELLLLIQLDRWDTILSHINDGTIPDTYVVGMEKETARDLTRTLDWYQEHNQYTDFIKNATGQSSSMAVTSSYVVAPLFRIGTIN